MNDGDKLEYIHYAIQEALNEEHVGVVDFDILEIALELVEELIKPHEEIKDV